MYETDGRKGYTVELRENRWQVEDLVTQDVEDEGLFVVLDDLLVKTTEGRIPQKIVLMLKKHWLYITDPSKARIKWFEKRQSIIWEKLGLFVVQDYDIHTTMVCCGTFSCVEGTKVISKFDGCFGLPLCTAIHLRTLGYILHRIENLVLNNQ